MGAFEIGQSADQEGGSTLMHIIRGSERDQGNRSL